MTDQTDRIVTDFVHAHFPALSSPWVFFDNAGGSQVVRGTVERISEFLFERNVQVGGSYDVSRAAAAALREGREAVQTMMGAERAEEIVFGHSTTVLIQTLAAAMRGSFAPGDEIVVSTADHESNIGPWERLREAGVTIRYWHPDSESGDLRLEDLDSLMGPRTRLVCIHHVSNILGRINPVGDIAAFVHARGALICVDAVAYAPHRAVDVRAWDVDFYVFSLYKCYGPHIAVMYGKYELLRELDGLYHYFYGKEKVPGKLEPGNPTYELAYSAAGILDYLLALGAHEGAAGTPRARMEGAFAAITRQEDALVERLLAYLRRRGDARVVGPDAPEAGSARVPTVSFKIDGRPSSEIARAMDAYHIAIRFGDFHSRRLVERLGENGDDGVIRVSMLHYNTLAQVDRLTAALSEITATRAAAG